MHRTARTLTSGLAGLAILIGVASFAETPAGAGNAPSVAQVSSYQARTRILDDRVAALDRRVRILERVVLTGTPESASGTPGAYPLTELAAHYWTDRSCPVPAPGLNVTGPCWGEK